MKKILHAQLWDLHILARTTSMHTGFFQENLQECFFFFSVKVKSLPKVGDIVNKMEVNIKHGTLPSALPSHYINFLKFSLLPTEILSVFQRQSFL